MRQNILATVLWLVIGGAIIAQQTIIHSRTQANKTHLTSSDETTSDTENPAYYITHNAIITVPHISIDQGYYQIKEIIFEEKTSLKLVHRDVPRYESSHKLTLFRSIISPNAP